MPDPIDLAAIVASNMRGERARRRLLQRELAERIGVSTATESDMETGIRKVALNDLLPLCRAMDVTLTELFRGLPAEDLRALGL